MPSVVVYENTTYRTMTRSKCPVVPGVPLALNPLLVPFAAAAVLLTGPLLPLVVVGLVAAFGYALASRLEY